MKTIDGGVTAPDGFLAANTAAEIKYKDRDDMALIYSEEDCVAAGCFTKNVVKAAPVVYDRALVENGNNIRAVVINAGIANAATGEKGMELCRETARCAAGALDIGEDEVCVASTGVIGMQLPMSKLAIGIHRMKDELSSSRRAANAAARAIMTTDTIPKEVAVECQIGDTRVTIGAMSKGSGMIHPDMCTMLAFITTDAVIEGGLLQEALAGVVEDTYNMISVDGDTSTNDTVLLLANGRAGNNKINKEDGSFDIFVEALFEVNRTLARMMAGDGEGATALIEVHVENAPTTESAKLLARSVISSSLTKAAIYGHDANWGRILCALGYSGVDFDPNDTDISISSKAGELCLVKHGVAMDYSEEQAGSILSEKEIRIICDMHSGDGQADAWGCDLTYDYVKINADYRS